SDENSEAIKDATRHQQTNASVDEEIFQVVEEMPQFQGKDANAFRNWIGENLKYPESAAQNKISGKVFVQFCVDSKGKVTDVEIVRGADKALDEEALRVVKSSPDWIPGKQHGKEVKVQFTFPIVFALK
ncbi:MAG: energy transducer TonB, partial [Bacteroidales bacterium]|nr:energy transducer TonB [Bacteroidales bacterium]